MQNLTACQIRFIKACAPIIGRTWKSIIADRKMCDLLLQKGAIYSQPEMAVRMYRQDPAR
jgi:hypothetical protein